MLEARGATDIGLVRSVNQDSLFVDPNKGIFIVADGMGGHAGGEIASSICIETVSEHLTSCLEQSNQQEKEHVQGQLEKAINLACSRIYDQALQDPELKGMGTTATVLQINNSQAYVGQVGDSRLYVLRSGFLYQITYDHSLVSEQVRAGHLTEKEAEHHQLKNIITRSVGYQSEELVDTFCFSLIAGDIILICSDGLHGKLQDQELSHALKKNDIDAVHDLIDLANDRGGEDNITVVVVKFSD